MVMDLRYLGVTLSFLSGCSSEIVPYQKMHPIDGLDAGLDVVDAYPDGPIFDGYAAPVPGEYPPNGDQPCFWSGCAGQGACDLETGWCCGGSWKEQQCRCGASLGCLLPEVCCALPGALEFQCVADCPVP